MFNRIIEILSLPIMILNMVGGIIGGIWLAILGEWGLIGIGILLMFTSHWILAILMMPSLLFMGIAMHFYEKKNFLAYLFVFISQLYTNLLIVATFIFAFFIFLHQVIRLEIFFVCQLAKSFHLHHLTLPLDSQVLSNQKDCVFHLVFLLP